MLILAASVGAAFSGAVLYSYYQYRLQKTDDRVNALVNGYKKQFDKASADLAAQRDAAKAQIASALGPLQQLQASPQTLQALIKKAAPSLWFVHTLDVNGQPSVGSAFAVASNPSQTLLLTSYTTVVAATRKPGPQVLVRQGTVDTSVNVWTWDERYDLALLILPKGGVPVLHAAGPAPAIGQRVFAALGPRFARRFGDRRHRDRRLGGRLPAHRTGRPRLPGRATRRRVRQRAGRQLTRATSRSTSPATACGSLPTSNRRAPRSCSARPAGWADRRALNGRPERAGSRHVGARPAEPVPARAGPG